MEKFWHNSKVLNTYPKFSFFYKYIAFIEPLINNLPIFLATGICKTLKIMDLYSVTKINRKKRILKQLVHFNNYITNLLTTINTDHFPRVASEQQLVLIVTYLMSKCVPFQFNK